MRWIMKKVKYLIVIIIIFILVFIGIDFLGKEENIQNKIENKNQVSNETTKNNIITDGNIEDDNKTQTSNLIEEIKNGQELLLKADKILTARGWAGASNNIIGIKDKTIYYYNKGTEEFRKIAIEIDDIYYKTGDSEEITAKKTDKTEIIGEIPEFLIFE